MTRRRADCEADRGAQSRRADRLRQLWHFGLRTEEVAEFLADYGWRLIEQAGQRELVERYVKPTGRNLTASELEWSAYAEKES